MRLALVLIALARICLAVPSPRPSHHVVHEKRAAEPIDWSKSRRIEGHKVLPMRFGLTQQNLHRVEEMLLAVSHPESPTYGQHWSPAKVVDTFAPSHDTIGAVTDWLAVAGIPRERLRLSASKGWIELNATVAEAENLLNAEYHVYSHVESGDEQIGCESYSVPAHVRPHIDLIKPTVHFNHRLAPQLSKRASNLGAPSASRGPKRKSFAKVAITPSLATCDQMITLDCLRALYSVDYQPIATEKNSFGIVEFTPQSFLEGDLDLFFGNFSPSLVGVRPNIVLIDGAVVQTTDQSFNFNGESDLDLEYAMGLTNPDSATNHPSSDCLYTGAGFDNWIDAVDESFCTFEGGDDPTQDGIYPDPLPGGFKGPESCGIIAPPNVVSISYGQDESTVTPAFANRQCQEYAKLGLMGTSVFYSSGDNGVAGNGGVCLNARHQPVKRKGTVFNPDFPVTCPFVTAVGATQVNPGSTVTDPEGACEQVIFSGGGFSNIFPMPSYQADAVTNFLRTTPPPYTNGQFNNSGTVRGFPDLSANGPSDLLLGINGEFGLVFGTSASSPVVGSLITLVNDARIAQGKGPVGFINPAIYSTTFKDAFNDITSGGNQGCGTPGFTATAGWDPVTGVGTPNLTKLMPLFLALP
ncbi:subtilisin-like protein [Lyophyllum atratum]|nr:subtilisin-like protein [Lyophyllum atratum]